MNKYDEDTEKRYKKYRLQVFIGIFVGYAAYYLVRKNLSLALPDLQRTYGYTKDFLGLALSFLGFGYGLSKFIMGGLSDKSNAKYFLSIGLFLTAITTIIAGTEIGLKNLYIISILQFLIGWFGGMGWPPCGRIMTHWFSMGERATKMSIWNTAHNVGGAIIGPITAYSVLIFIAIGTTGFFTIDLSSLGINNSWHIDLNKYISQENLSYIKDNAWRLGIFVVPAIIAIICALFSFILLKDNPKSHGLPSIEEYTNEYPSDYSEKHETKLSAKEIFIKYVFKNKLLWIIAIANAFVYLIRYGVLDWAPTYLSEVKGYNIKEIGWAYFSYEFAAIPGTIICGLVCDKLFGKRRSITTIVYIILVIIAVIIYWLNPKGHIMIDIGALIAIGFLIYGPVMLIGVHALDLAPKNAAGAAAGFTGFFGYALGTSILANIVMGYITTHYGWASGFIFLILAGIITVILMLFTIPHENKQFQKINKSK